MSHSFVAYIDESGDDGIGNFRQPGAHGGASNWLVISALVLRQTNELDAVSWRDGIGALMPEKRSRSIHFANMNHGQRVAATRSLGQRPIRTVSVLSNKRTIPDGVYREKNQLYFYLTRYLLERVSWLCRDLRPKVHQGDGRVKITFSRRGGMSYPDFRDYLQRLKDSADPDIKVHWPVIDIDGIDAKDHSTHAGLQLVDTVASAFASGVEPDKYGNCECRYAENLKRVVYERNGNFLSYGVKIVPRHTEMEITPEQARMIELFK